MSCSGTGIEDEGCDPNLQISIPGFKDISTGDDDDGDDGGDDGGDSKFEL